MTLENYAVNVISQFPYDGLIGRRKITTTYKKITRDNVLDILKNTLDTHSLNAAEITYLWGYYRGQQDILHKHKIVRNEINNKVLVNRANEIVTFKTAYLLNEPIQYVSHGGNDTISDKVNILNEMMREEDKASKDKEIVDWMHICGVGVRLVLPDKNTEYESVPFHVDTLDPREAYCIYNSGIGRKKIGGVILQQDEDGDNIAYVYTPEVMFTIKGETVTEEPHIIGAVPLIEYVNNMARMGAFEVVLPILNSINNLESFGVDSVEDFVNGFDVFQNCEISNGDYGKLSIGGQAVQIKTTVPGMEAKVYRICSELSQTGLQTRIDDQTGAYLEICGMPNRNGGSSTSDTGTAVLFRDGWSAAASRAKDTSTLFKQAEKKFDEIVLRICDKKAEKAKEGAFKLEGLKISDFEVKFPFGNLQNIQSLAQVFTELLNNPKVHPKTAYEVAAALFRDSEEAMRIGLQWYNDNKQAEEESLNNAVNAQRQSVKDGDSDSEESNSQTLTYSGKTQTISEWANETGISSSAIRSRLKRGWSVEKTLGTPKQN